jgi:hemerythrin superfamily protein
MDAISLLTRDHRAVEKLFSRFEKTSDQATKSRRALVDEMIEALSRHAAIEEEYFYPAARQALGPSHSEIVLEAIEEHHVVKWTLNELLSMSPRHERFKAKVVVLMESVRHHVEEEEGELFPKLRKIMDAATLKTLGKTLELARSRAPTRPHPRAPDSPPGNRVVAPLAAAMDRSRDLLVSLTARRGKQRKAVVAKSQLH